MLRLFSSCHIKTLSLRGFTKSSMNVAKNASVSSCSFSVKKNICPSLNETGTWIDVGSAIEISFSLNTVLISQLLQGLL